MVDKANGEPSPRSLLFQVGRVTLGGRAVAREQRAISDIESKGYIVIFVPYNQ